MGFLWPPVPAGEGGQGREALQASAATPRSAPVWADGLSGFPPSISGRIPFSPPVLALSSHLVFFFLDSLTCFGEAQKRCLGIFFV